VDCTREGYVPKAEKRVVVGAVKPEGNVNREQEIILKRRGRGMSTDDGVGK
jgi:hypothetical protein